MGSRLRLKVGEEAVCPKSSFICRYSPMSAVTFGTVLHARTRGSASVSTSNSVIAGARGLTQI